MYLSSKHQSTGDLGGMRYPNRLLSKNLPLCTCNYPFYSAYNSLNHRVNFGQFKLCTDIEKNPGPSVYVDATKTIHVPYCQGNVALFVETAGGVTKTQTSKTQTSDPKKLRPPGCLENTDPEKLRPMSVAKTHTLNIFQILQLTIVREQPLSLSHPQKRMVLQKYHLSENSHWQNFDKTKFC